MNVEKTGKLFRNKDARARLAGMGGIIASSPELLGTVQKFANGSRRSGSSASLELLDLMSQEEG